MHLSACYKGRFFTVIDDDFMEHAGIFHSFPHEITVFYEAAIIRKSDDASLGHATHSRQFFAFQSFGNGTDDFYFDDAFMFSLIFHSFYEDGFNVNVIASHDSQI